MMAETHLDPRRHPPVTRRWLGRAGVVAGVVATGAFVYSSRKELPATWRVIRSADPRFVALGLIASVAWLAALASMHAAAQRAAGLRVGAPELFATATAANALNLLTKSAGIAGIAMFVRRARRHGQPRGLVAAAYVMAQAFGELAFVMMLGGALAAVAVTGRLNTAEVLASCAVAVLLAAKLFVLAAALHSRDSVRSVYEVPRRLARRVLRRPPHQSDTTSVADEMFDAMALARRNPGRSVPVAGYAMSLEVVGVMQMWAACSAVGASRSLVVAMMAYSISVLFGIVGFLPGGLGFVEVSLGALLVSFGAPVASAAAAVVVFRVLELWLPLVVGTLLVRRLRGSTAVVASA